MIYSGEVTPFSDFVFGDCTMGCFGVTSGYSQPRIIRRRIAIRFPKIIAIPVTKRGVPGPEISSDLKNATLLVCE